MADMISRIDRYRQTIRNWWLALLMGLAFIAMGIVVFRHPGETYIALALFFGLLIFVSGVIQIFIGAYAPKDNGRGWMIASGVIEAIIGLILIFNTNVSAVVLPLFLGFWLLFRSLTMIGFASDMRGAGIRGTGWTIFWAVLLMLASVMILIFPAIGIGAIVVWLGISLILGGLAMTFFSIYLYGQRKHLGIK